MESDERSHDSSPSKRYFPRDGIATLTGWLANELFVFGGAAYRSRPQIALRAFAFALGIMVSWQVVFIGYVLHYVGYWAGVAAGAMMLGLTANRVAERSRRHLGAALAERVTLALVVLPVLNAAVGIGLDKWQ